MTAAVARAAGGSGQEAIEFPHVLAGVGLDGPAAALARALDKELLAEAGWDPATRILFLPAEHRLLGRKVCRVDRCAGTAHNDYPDICHRCFTRLTRMGMTMDEIATSDELPAAPVPAPHCAVPECRCVPIVPGAELCEPHAGQLPHQAHSRDVEEFVTASAGSAPPAVAGLPDLGVHPPADGAVGYCGTHYQRWRIAQRNDPGIDERVLVDKRNRE